MLLDADAIGQGLVAGELVARRSHARLRRCQRALGIGQRGFGVVQLFFGHGAVADQRLTPLQIVLGAIDVALRPHDIGLAQRHLRTQRTVVDIQRAHLSHRLGQRRFGLIERHASVRRIELDQRLAGLHEIGVVGHDGHHRAADLRRDLNHVALHVGVVGVFIVAGDQPFIEPPGAT